jgi:hypothetical protein
LTVCYGTDYHRSIKEMDDIGKEMAEEVRRSAPEMDLEILFRGA